MREFKLVTMDQQNVLLYSLSNNTMGIKYPEKDLGEDSYLYFSNELCLAIAKSGKQAMLYSTTCKNGISQLRKASDKLLSCDDANYRLFNGGLILSKEMLGDGDCTSVQMFDCNGEDASDVTLLLYSDTVAITVKYTTEYTEYVVRKYKPIRKD